MSVAAPLAFRSPRTGQRAAIAATLISGRDDGIRFDPILVAGGDFRDALEPPHEQGADWGGSTT